jgi:hypothetical protein
MDIFQLSPHSRSPCSFFCINGRRITPLQKKSINIIIMNSRQDLNVEYITYRDYDNCVRIFNNTTEVIVVPQAGGRVLAYRIPGEDIIYRNPAQDGKSYADFLFERFDPDAGRFDLGWERDTETIHDNLWMGPYEVEITGKLSVKLTSQYSHQLGIKLEREFILDSTTSHLIVRQTMINLSEKETSWFFWGRTLVPIGGKLVMPLNPISKYPHGWGDFAGEPWGFRIDNPSHHQMQIKDGKLIFHAENTDHSAKFATDASEGWMAYTLNNLVFVKRFEVAINGIYTDHQTAIVYTHSRDFIEMEPNSPHALLKPGERYTFEEHWWLLENTSPEKDILDTIDRALKFTY